MPEKTEDALLHITDLHFHQLVKNPLQLLNKRFIGNLNVYLHRRHEFRMESAETFADAAAKTGVKIILIGGDFTSTATDDEFKLGAEFVRGLQRRGFEIILMPGNHDVYTFESWRLRRFEKHFGEFMAHGKYPCRMTLPGGTPLLLVPTVVPNFFSAKGRITSKEIAETGELLEECRAGHVLVAGHYPILHRTYGYESGPSRQLRNADGLRGMLGRSGREVLYMAGHVHRFSYVHDTQYSSLQQLTTAAFFMHRRNEDVRGSFSEVQVNAEGLGVYWHSVKDAWTRELQTVRPNVF